MKLSEEINKKFRDCAFWIKEASKETGIDPFVISAICWQESSFDPYAFRFEKDFLKKYVEPLTKAAIKKRNPSIGGAISEDSERHGLAISWGAMQILGQTARERGFNGVFLPALCGYPGILYGSEHLVYLRARHHDWDKVFSAYNAGSPTNKNQTSYVEAVLERLDILQNEKEVSRCFK